jgi:hypothetical protein
MSLQNTLPYFRLPAHVHKGCHNRQYLGVSATTGKIVTTRLVTRVAAHSSVDSRNSAPPHKRRLEPVFHLLRKINVAILKPADLVSSISLPQLGPTSGVRIPSPYAALFSTNLPGHPLLAPAQNRAKAAVPRPGFHRNKSVDRSWPRTVAGRRNSCFRREPGRHVR